MKIRFLSKKSPGISLVSINKILQYIEDEKLGIYTLFQNGGK